MTTLTSLLDYASLVPGPIPSVSPLSDQSGSSGGPLWATLLVGLLGGLLGGTGTYFGARRSARSARQSAEKSLKHERTRLLNERFTTAAELLGHDEAACRLAGVHAMAGLADDWTKRRQTCINVLCAYLRMPYSPQPDDTAPAEERLNWQANREVRRTVVRTIGDHQQVTQAPSTTSWDGHDYDFTGTVFDSGDFSSARFTGEVRFKDTKFTGGRVSFRGAEFSEGSKVTFYRAEFTKGSTVSFKGAQFTEGSTVGFRGAQFTGGTVDFRGAQFTGGTVDFSKVGSWTVPLVFDNGVLAHPPAGLLLPTPDSTGEAATS
ncbi:hypothetical protein ABZW30_46600 [Kitasatospora sp. NPDC004669]|uniref:pentapeptide repeat-containing protein n=1 Tax=Kitasatospora sp. NPDC004669 TaxID=3154555 RepID=UPI0033AAF480